MTDGLLAVPEGNDVFGYLLTLLFGLGLASSEARLVYALAQLHLQRAMHRLTTARAQASTDADSGDLIAEVETYLLAVEQVNGLAATYARASARYVEAAAQVAKSMAADQSPAQQLITANTSEVLVDPLRFVPLVQIPVTELAEDWQQIGTKANTDLTDHRAQLETIIGHLPIRPTRTSSARTFQPGKVHDLDAISQRLPDALQTYADDCMWAITLLVFGRR